MHDTTTYVLFSHSVVYFLMNAVLHATDSSGSTVETLYHMSLDMGWMVP